MTAEIILHSIRDLRASEPRILDLINREARGSELFLVNPLRFLREHGFDVSPELESDLERRLTLSRLPSHLYDDIRAGKHRLVPGIGATASVRSVRIDRLGIPTENGK